MAVGSGEFEVAGDAGDGEEAVVVWAVRNGLPDDYRHGLLPATGSGCALRRSSSGFMPPQAGGRRGQSHIHPHRAERRIPDGGGCPASTISVGLLPHTLPCLMMLPKFYGGRRPCYGRSRPPFVSPWLLGRFGNYRCQGHWVGVLPILLRPSVPVPPPAP